MAGKKVKKAKYKFPRLGIGSIPCLNVSRNPLGNLDFGDYIAKLYPEGIDAARDSVKAIATKGEALPTIVIATLRDKDHDVAKMWRAHIKAAIKWAKLSGNASYLEYLQSLPMPEKVVVSGHRLFGAASYGEIELTYDDRGVISWTEYRRLNLLENRVSKLGLATSYRDEVINILADLDDSETSMPLFQSIGRFPAGQAQKAHAICRCIVRIGEAPLARIATMSDAVYRSIDRMKAVKLADEKRTGDIEEIKRYFDGLGGVKATIALKERKRAIKALDKVFLGLLSSDPEKWEKSLDALDALISASKKDSK